MLSIHQLKSKINVAKSTSQITSALKLISAATYPKVVQKKTAFDSYVKNQFEIVAEIAAHCPEEFYDFVRGFSKNKNGNLLIIFASSRGLCGAFNSLLEKKIIHELPLDQEKPLDVILVGRNAPRILSNVRLEKKLNVRTITQLASAKADEIFQYFSNTTDNMLESYERVYVVYNKLKSIFIQQPVAGELVSEFCKKIEIEVRNRSSDSRDLFLWQVPTKQFFQSLAKHFFVGRIVQCAHNSISGEIAARFVATDQATANAKKQIDHLTALYNKTRQSQVTNEVIELASSGAFESGS